MAALVISGVLCGSLPGHPFLVVESWVDMGRSSASGSFGHGGGVGWLDLLACQARVQ